MEQEVNYVRKRILPNRESELFKHLLIGLAVGTAIGMIFESQSSLLAAATGPGAAPANAGPDETCSREQEAANKRLVASLKPGSETFHALLDKNYVQHGAEYSRFARINGVSDYEAVRLMESLGSSRTAKRLAPPAPGQPKDNYAYKILAECDFVVAVGEHWHADPVDAGKFYPTYFFNMWRLKDGKLAEHWDPDDLQNPLPDYLKVPVSELQQDN